MIMDLCNIKITEIASIATSISCMLAFLGLAFTGYQFKRMLMKQKKNTFLNSCDRYIAIRKMLIEDESLSLIYDRHIATEDLNQGQKFYIYVLITFCESLFLTEQINIFSKYEGGNWRNFIKHSMQYETINELMDKRN